MNPFKRNPNPKKLHLPKSDYYLKDEFVKMISSSNAMYQILKKLLKTKNNINGLHGFVELGGLKKMYDFLLSFYEQNDSKSIEKWLNLLNDDNFPIDTELIKQIGLANFVHSRIPEKWNKYRSITTAICNRWHVFAKKENQHKKLTKKLKFKQKSDINRQIVFKRADKPSQLISNKRKLKNGFKTQSILKKISSTNKNKNKNKNKFNLYLSNTDPMDIINNTHNEHEIQTNDGDGIIIEDLGIPGDDDDNDIDMNDNDESDDDDLPLFGENNNKDEYPLKSLYTNGNHKHQAQNIITEHIYWYHPMPLILESDTKRFCDTEASNNEEKRIEHIRENDSQVCVELPSSIQLNDDNNNNKLKIIPNEYPHWSDISKYREKNDIE